MEKPRRHEVFLDLIDFDPPVPSGRLPRLVLRSAEAADRRALGGLMLGAYRGTIDDDGETIAEALREIDGYLAGEHGGPPLLSESRLAFAGQKLVGACLAQLWRERERPLIAYVMTDPAWKQQGIATHLLKAVLADLVEQGFRQVQAVITEGNTPSERLFGRLGFRVIGSG